MNLRPDILLALYATVQYILTVYPDYLLFETTSVAVLVYQVCEAAFKAYCKILKTSTFPAYICLEFFIIVPALR